MRDSGAAPQPVSDAADPAYEIARELHGILPFGVRPDTVTRCPLLAEQVAGHAEDRGGDRGVPCPATAVVAAIESVPALHLPDHHAEPLRAALVRRMLHVLLATRDLGWPGTDAPLSVRRVAAADLFFDDTQTVLSDHDWKGPDGVEFALLTALAGRVCGTRRADGAPTAGADERRAHDTGGEVLGQLHRVRRPRGL